MPQQGNIDLFAQPKVKNPDGSISTVDSISIGTDDGKEILIPRVTPDGRHLSSQDAIAEFKKTGRHLGIFASIADADKYAEQLHNDYAAGKYDRKPNMPKNGEQKTFPNGAVGQWDGTGWLMVTPPKAAPSEPTPDQGSLKQDINDAGVGALKGLAQTTSGAVGLIPGVTRATNAIGNAIGGMAGQALYGTKAEPVSPESARASLEPENTAEKVGKTAEQIGEFFVPAGAARKATIEGLVRLIPDATSPGAMKTLNKLAALAGRGIGEAGSAGAVAGLQGGDVGTAAALGAAGPLAAEAAGPVSKAIQHGLPLAAVGAAEHFGGYGPGMLGLGAYMNPQIRAMATMSPATVKALQRAIRAGAPLVGRGAAGAFSQPSPQQALLDQLGP